MKRFYHRLRERIWALEDRLTVRQQVGIWAALLVVTLVGALAAGAALISYRQVSDLTRAQLGGVAQSTADRLDRFMFVRQQELTLFAGIANIHEISLTNPQELKRLLERLQGSFKEFLWIGFAGPDGKVISSTGGLLEGVDVSQRPWFIDGKLNLTIKDVHEAVLLAGLLDSRSDKEPYRFVDIGMPIRTRDGYLIGVLGAHLNWDWSRDLVASLEQQYDAQISIVAKDGTMLLGPEVGSKPFSKEQFAEIRAARTGVFMHTRGGEDQLTAFDTTAGFRDYPGLEWVVIAQRPARVALQAAAGNAWGILFIGALLGMLGVAFALLIAGRVAKPINAMTAEADRLGRTSAAAMFARQRGSLEAVQLTRALRSLMRRIGFAEERTREAELRASENAKQFHDDVSKLRRLAEIDDLTGLLNRRAFITAAGDAMNYFKRYRRSIATLMIDIDHFKKINDAHGHAAGDGAIKRVAELIGDCIRTTDKAARFGGEEFVVLLREVDEVAARELAERIRSTIETTGIAYGRLELRFTVSVGIALASEADRDIADVVERADQALYIAKNAGRNRVVYTPAEDQELARVA
jgi:diguanylate cyclase (GGDEF)-like protein